jgi:hypothetical protein
MWAELDASHGLQMQKRETVLDRAAKRPLYLPEKTGFLSFLFRSKGFFYLRIRPVPSKEFNVATR